jgi:hypothetical protein
VVVGPRRGWPRQRKTPPPGGFTDAWVAQLQPPLKLPTSAIQDNYYQRLDGADRSLIVTPDLAEHAKELSNVWAVHAMQRWFDPFANALALGWASLWATLPTLLASTEFWSALAGAFVGGLIAYLVQLLALREGRKQRQEDRLQAQQALAYSLVFKVIRIHSDYFGIYRHVEEFFELAAKRGIAHEEPWRFVLPLANFPDPVHFSPEEMGMLLSLKNDDVFNEVLGLDISHNSLLDVARLVSAERRNLTDRLKVDEANAEVLTGTDHQTYLALRPRMIEVNGLIQSLRVEAKAATAKSKATMERLQQLLRNRLGLTLRVQSKSTA